VTRRYIGLGMRSTLPWRADRPCGPRRRSWRPACRQKPSQCGSGCTSAGMQIDGNRNGRASVPRAASLAWISGSWPGWGRSAAVGSIRLPWVPKVARQS
jgi:hypothetical protein